MRINSIEELVNEPHTYKAEVVMRSAPKWKFWDKSETIDIYIGNSVGWYNPMTGARLKNNRIEMLLANELRKIYLKSMLDVHNKKNHKLKPIK